MFSTLLPLLTRLREFNARNARRKAASRPRVERKRNRPVLEPLEDRTLLSTIGGRVVEDLTGDGITPDDQPLAGWTVQLTEQQESTLLAADFNDGSGGPSLDGFTATGLWHVTTACPGTDVGQSSPEAAFVGDDVTCGLDANAEPSDLTSPAINLPADGISAVEFLYRLGNEDGTLAGVASLQISVDGGDFTTLASNSDDSISVSNSWASFWLNLSDYASHTVVLRLHFEPDVAATSNDFGWQVDDLSVTYQYSVEADTDSQGNYALETVEPGTYELIAFGPYGWTETAAPESTVTVTDNNQTLTGYDFGEWVRKSRALPCPPMANCWRGALALGE